MKRAYSTVSTGIGRIFKKSCKSRGEADFAEFADTIYSRTVERIHLSKVADEDTMATELYAYYLWKFRRLDHYFLDDGLAEFCASSVKDLSGDFCKTLPDCPTQDLPRPRQKWMMDRIVATNDYKLTGGLVVHFPSHERSRSVVIMPGLILQKDRAKQEAALYFLPQLTARTSYFSEMTRTQSKWTRGRTGLLGSFLDSAFTWTRFPKWSGRLGPQTEIWSPNARAV